MAVSCMLHIIIILERIWHLSTIFYVKFVKCNLRISYCLLVYTSQFSNSIHILTVGMFEIYFFYQVLNVLTALLY